MLWLFEIQMCEYLFVTKSRKSMKDVFIKHAFGPESVFRFLVFVFKDFETNVFDVAS